MVLCLLSQLPVLLLVPYFSYNGVVSIPFPIYQQYGALDDDDGDDDVGFNDIETTVPWISRLLITSAKPRAHIFSLVSMKNVGFCILRLSWPTYNINETGFLLLKCCFTSTETVSLLWTRAQDIHLDFHTAPELWRSSASLFSFISTTQWFICISFFRL